MRLYENSITITDEIINGANIMTDCERFGMSRGCHPDCPTFQLGNCQLQEENEDFFKKEGMYDD